MPIFAFSSSLLDRFIQSGLQADHERPSIAGALMAQYLTAVLGNHDHGGMLFGMPENGRMGDYVFNQEGESTVFTHPSGGLKFTYSSGSNNNTNNGEFEYAQTRPCY